MTTLTTQERLEMIHDAAINTKGNSWCIKFINMSLMTYLHLQNSQSQMPTAWPHRKYTISPSITVDISKRGDWPPESPCNDARTLISALSPLNPTTMHLLLQYGGSYPFNIDLNMKYGMAKIVFWNPQLKRWEN